MLLYHGVLAPNARWRSAVVPPLPMEELPMEELGGAASSPEPVLAVSGQRRRERPKYRAWADLMRRAFAADVLACPRCGGRMVLLATIEDPAVITRILTHLGLSRDSGEPTKRALHPTSMWLRASDWGKAAAVATGRHRRRPSAAAVRP